jgi:O-antigen/teichoic acid export membrane protein
MIGLAINSAYVPIFFKLYEDRSVNKNLYSLSDFIIYFNGFLTVFVVFFAKVYVEKAFGPDYSKVLDCLVFMCSLSLMNSIYLIYTNVLSLEVKLVRLKTICIIVGTSINLLCGYFFTKKYGLVGASIGTLIGFSLTTFLLIFVAKHKTNFKFAYKKHILFFAYVFSALLLMQMFSIFDSSISDSVIKSIIASILICFFILSFEHRLLKNYFHEHISFKKSIR